MLPCGAGAACIQPTLFHMIHFISYSIQSMQEGSLECYLVELGLPPEEVDNVVTQVRAACMPYRLMGGDRGRMAVQTATAAAVTLLPRGRHDTHPGARNTSRVPCPAPAGGGVARHPRRPLAHRPPAAQPGGA